MAEVWHLRTIISTGPGQGGRGGGPRIIDQLFSVGGGGVNSPLHIDEVLDSCLLSGSALTLHLTASGRLRRHTHTHAHRHTRTHIQKVSIFLAPLQLKRVAPDHELTQPYVAQHGFSARDHGHSATIRCTSAHAGVSAICKREALACCQ